MMKNFLIHGGWLAVAAIAFAFGRSQKAEPTGIRQRDGRGGTLDPRAAATEM
ncbi:MAG: hypothetical protein R3F11_00950 [Verrucomicrobiales bacterium]